MRTTTKRLLLPLILCIPALCAWSFDHGQLRYSAEGRASLSSGENTPFWLMNNQYGLSSIKKSNGYLRAGFFADLDTTDRKFKWGAGADIAIPYGYTSHFIIQQLYVDLRYRCLGLMAGSKEFKSGFTDESLSSGDLLHSNNARPIPQIRIGIPEYTAIPGTKNWLAVKGHVAFGRFTDDNWQRDFAGPTNHCYYQNILYHSKSLFFRISNMVDRNWAIEGGLEMAAQFGGERVNPGNDVIKFPHSFKDYLRAIFALAGGSSSPTSDQQNVFGNHLGAWKAAVTYAPVSGWTLKTYYEHFFEDHSMMFFDYPWKDGLLGFQITPPTNPVISNFVYEYLYTKFQSGPVYWDHNSVIDVQISGLDNYYNHGSFGGWQHWGMGIGNPLLTSPIYNKNGEIEFHSNRIIANHFGISGDPCKWLSYRLLFTYTQSWGTYGAPYKNVKSSLNTMLELTAPIGRVSGLQASVAVAVDRGNLIGHSAGAMITIKKTGIIK